MTRNSRWFESPAFNWTGAIVSLLMLALYVQQLMGPDQRPSTPWVTAAWAAMLFVWLFTAIYRTWFRKKR